MNQSQHAVSLEARSPFELRVNLGTGTPESMCELLLPLGKWDFFIPSLQARPSTDPVCAWLAGRAVANGGASIAITRTPGI